MRVLLQEQPSSADRETLDYAENYTEAFLGGIAVGVETAERVRAKGLQDIQSLIALKFDAGICAMKVQIVAGRNSEEQKAAMLGAHVAVEEDFILMLNGPSF